MPGRLCPHCLAALALTGPPQPVRCASCMLVVGTGRGIDDASQAVGDANVSAAAILSSVARRSDERAVDRDLVLDAIQAAADDLGVSVRTLRLLDYETARANDPQRPTVGEVLATFGEWKAARRAAWDRGRDIVSDAT